MSTAVSNLSAAARANLPRHVAVIMDGNGRWAKSRHLPRIEGHRRGADSAREIIRTAGELGIKYLTLYVLCTRHPNVCLMDMFISQKRQEVLNICKHYWTSGIYPYSPSLC